MVEQGKKRGAPSHDLFIHRFDVVVVVDTVETKRLGSQEKDFPSKRYDALPKSVGMVSQITVVAPCSSWGIHGSRFVVCEALLD